MPPDPSRRARCFAWCQAPFLHNSLKIVHYCYHVIVSLWQQVPDFALEAVLSGAASTLGHALNVGTRRKLTSHISDCRAAGVEFFPLVAETLGGLAKNTIHIISSIGKIFGQCSNPSDPATSISHLFVRLSISLWRGNACCWLHWFPSLPFFKNLK